MMEKTEVEMLYYPALISGEAELHERAEDARIARLHAENEPPCTAALFEDE